ncbi:Actin cortical patch SUR7/pH-response regulator PalI [Ceraceosorus bombacis]|uniref:Actin cortical patch SUR7/pH-response regulator PalI n=1 Tax=Ceraceosorus bombacis TaxID=401625 RepID=A0A0P1BE98_9BASI|nr:Actin cortical patch SUR7/pH-response regulator PalI [Ceraceosorus bombacis]
MGRRAFCVPALVTGFLAFALLLLSTISTPLEGANSSPFYVVEGTNLNNATDSASNANQQRQLSSIRLGNWGYCTKGTGEGGFSYCSDNQHAYNVTLNLGSNGTDVANQDQSAYRSTEIGPSWTRGLVVVVVAFVFSIIAFVLSFPPHLIVQLVASLIWLLTAVLALIAFAIQIALFIYTRQRLQRISPDASVMPGPSFYLTLISIPLSLFSAITVCCGYRKTKNEDSYGGYKAGSGASKPARFNPFKRNRGANATDASGSSIPLSSRQRVMQAFEKDNSQA